MNWQGRFETFPYGSTVFCLRWAEISDELMRRAVVDELAGQVSNLRLRVTVFRLGWAEI